MRRSGALRGSWRSIVQKGHRIFTPAVEKLRGRDGAPGGRCRAPHAGRLTLRKASHDSAPRGAGPGKYGLAQVKAGGERLGALALRMSRMTRGRGCLWCQARQGSRFGKRPVRGAQVCVLSMSASGERVGGQRREVGQLAHGKAPACWVCGSSRPWPFNCPATRRPQRRRGRPERPNQWRGGSAGFLPARPDGGTTSTKGHGLGNHFLAVAVLAGINSGVRFNAREDGG